MSTTIGRDHVVNLVTGNPHPFAVHFDLVVVAHHAALGRATIHQVAARTLAVISFERRVEALMPVVVACPVISFLRRCACTMKRGERAAEHRYEFAPFHSITSSGTSSENLIDRLPRKAISSVPKLAKRTPFPFVVNSFLVWTANYAVGHRD
jgi:hypothetical protein